MKKYNDMALAFLLLCAVFLLIFFSPRAKEGALEGVRLCENILLPSLLPVLILCQLMLTTRAKNAFILLFGRITEAVFHLPREAAPAIFLGLIGGYPTGTLLTHTLYRQGGISKEAAHRLLRFNFSGGAAFLITAVGTVCYGSLKTGLLLFGCNTASALLVALLLRGRVRPKEKRTSPSTAGIADALSAAVEQSVRALAMMAAYIIFFCAVTRIAAPPAFLAPLLEITSGVCTPAHLLPLPEAAFFLSFGGLCIHLQLWGYLREMGMRYGDFLLCRLGCAVLSFLLCHGALLLFPDSAAVFNNTSAPVRQFTQSGVTVSAVMIIGCAVAVFDLENRKIKLH